MIYKVNSDLLDSAEEKAGKSKKDKKKSAVDEESKWTGKIWKRQLARLVFSNVVLKIDLETKLI